MLTFLIIVIAGLVAAIVSIANDIKNISKK